jgi:hypothetical protein
MLWNTAPHTDKVTEFHDGCRTNVCLWYSAQEYAENITEFETIPRIRKEINMDYLFAKAYSPQAVSQKFKI